MKVREDWIIDDRDREYGRVDIKEKFILPEEMPTAFFCNCDISAYLLVRKLGEAGYKVPSDISVAGFDNSLLAKEATPKLTSLAQPLEEIGKKAVEVLLGQIRQNTDPQLYELETRVVARASTVNWKSPL